MLGEEKQRLYRELFGSLVKEERLRRGWSARELAERLGKAEREVFRIEEGQSPDTVEKLRAVANAFGMSLFGLFGPLLSDAVEGYEVTTDELKGELWKLFTEESAARRRAALDLPEIQETRELMASLPQEKRLAVLEHARGLVLDAHVPRAEAQRAFGRAEAMSAFPGYGPPTEEEKPDGTASKARKR